MGDVGPRLAKSHEAPIDFAQRLCLATTGSAAVEVRFNLGPVLGTRRGQ